MASTVLDNQIAEYGKFPDLPTDNQTVAAGRYKVSQSSAAYVGAVDSEIKSKVWFRSPPLSQDIIDRLSGVQLFASSHDQGHAEDVSSGLWTWLELVLLQDEHAEDPIQEDGIELAWRSHRNRPLSEDFSWNDGKVFSVDSDMLRFLQKGNIIGVRICARFPGWQLWVREALILFDIDKDTVERSERPQYGQILSRVNAIKDAMDEVNHHNDAPFKPKLAEQVTLQADALKSEEETPLRVLSLDGGGVRGFSTLLILQAILDKAATGKKPFELFDLIGGTSTGGLIAIMLARLKMSVSDCIDNYKSLMSTVFVNKAPFFSINPWTATFFGQGYFYDSAPLETAIKDVVKKAGLDPEVLLNVPGDTSGCKALSDFIRFVLAVRKDSTNNRAPVFLRSYLNPGKELELPGVKLWEAARATSAAPSYFPPIKVGDTELVDGGLAANNPLGWLWTEVATVFTPGRSTDCFLSIGTGMASNAALSDLKLSVMDPKGSAKSAMDFGMGLVSAATNSESTNVLFRVLLNEYAPKERLPKYFRLNYEEIDQSTSTEGLTNFVDLASMDDASTSAVKHMEVKTMEWIKKHDDLITQAAEALKRSVQARAKNS